MKTPSSVFNYIFRHKLARYTLIQTFGGQLKINANMFNT